LQHNAAANVRHRQWRRRRSAFTASNQCYLRHEATPAVDEVETGIASEAGLGSRRRRRRWWWREEQRGEKRESDSSLPWGPTCQGPDVLLPRSSCFPSTLNSGDGSCHPASLAATTPRSLANIVVPDSPALRSGSSQPPHESDHHPAVY
jgi:hypothetical protein